MDKNENVTKQEVYRALKIIESLANFEAHRIATEKTRQRREAKREGFVDNDHNEMIEALMDSDCPEAGLRILSEDVSVLTHNLDFENEDLLADVRSLAEQFMLVAAAANDKIENVNSAQAYAWQRAFRLLRKVNSFAYVGKITGELEIAPEAMNSRLPLILRSM